MVYLWAAVDQSINALLRQALPGCSVARCSVETHSLCQLCPATAMDGACCSILYSWTPSWVVLERYFRLFFFFFFSASLLRAQHRAFEDVNSQWQPVCSLVFYSLKDQEYLYSRFRSGQSFLKKCMRRRNFWRGTRVSRFCACPPRTSCDNISSLNTSSAESPRSRRCDYQTLSVHFTAQAAGAAVKEKVDCGSAFWANLEDVGHLFSARPLSNGVNARANGLS